MKSFIVSGVSHFSDGAHHSCITSRGNASAKGGSIAICLAERFVSIAEVVKRVDPPE